MAKIQNAVDATIQGLQNLNTTTGAWTGRTITSTDGSVTVTNGDGTAGNPNLSVSQSFPYYSLTPYIVGPDIHSQYSTIGAALAASVAAGVSFTTPANIFIKPKFDGYIENITLVDGQNLIAFGCQETFSGNMQVTLQGNITMTTEGTASVTGMGIVSTGDYCVTVSGSNNTYLNLLNCTLNTSNHTLISLDSSVVSAITLTNCVGDVPVPSIGLFSVTGIGNLVFNYCNFTNSNNSATNSTISSGLFGANWSSFADTITSSGTGAISVMNSAINTSSANLTCLVIGGSGGCVWRNGQFLSGTASAISISTTMTGTFLDVDSSNTHTITGSGAFTYGFIAFSGSSSGHNVTTENALATLI